jgi:hypothetical protein
LRWGGERTEVALLGLPAAFTTARTDEHGKYDHVGMLGDGLKTAWRRDRTSTSLEVFPPLIRVLALWDARFAELDTSGDVSTALGYRSMTVRS